MTKSPKQTNKKADINSMPVKYFNNRTKGMNKSQSQLAAGYADVNHGNRIENSKEYKIALEEFLLEEDVVAKEHNKNIMQSEDKGAKNKAIDMYYKLKKSYPSDSTSIDDSNVSITISKA